jgi:hypothetical protein
MKASYVKSRSVKGWGKRAPKLVSQRRQLLARCGVKAFLSPTKLKFPVMAKTGGCVYDCAGLRVAYSRAKQFKHPVAAKKAQLIAARAKCRWI